MKGTKLPDVIRELARLSYKKFGHGSTIIVQTLGFFGCTDLQEQGRQP